MFILNAAVSANNPGHQHRRMAIVFSKEAHRTDCGVMHDQEDVRIPRHAIQHCRKLWQLHLERMKLLAHSRTRVLQRFDQLARALVSRRAQAVFLIWAVGSRGGGDHEEGRALE